MTYFHSKNVYFYIHYSNSLKVTALNMFQKSLGSHPPYAAINEYLELTFLKGCQRFNTISTSDFEI